MGAVYEALDTRLRSTVALKQTLVGGDQLLKAFEREAQLLSNLQHPALPHVIDYFSEEHGQFLVMQYIAGEDLGGMLKRERRPAPLETVLAWADQLLDVLAYLHANDPPIVHRDIKPDNLKLTSRGTLVLLDFGLAKGSTSAMTRAATGSILGYTPSFAPLEQIRGLGTDVRSDLYSAAATLYALLSAETPTDALTRADSILNGSGDPLRRLDSINPSVSPAVADVLHSALALKRDDRPATASEMRSRLAAAASGHVHPAHSAAAFAPLTSLDNTAQAAIPEAETVAYDVRAETSPQAGRTMVERSADPSASASGSGTTARPTTAVPSFAMDAESTTSGSTRKMVFGGVVLVVVLAAGGTALWRLKPWNEPPPPTAAKTTPSTADGLNSNSVAVSPSGGFVATPTPQPAPSSTTREVPDSPKADSPVEPATPADSPADKPDREPAGVVRVSEGALRGNAVRIATTAYPPMAKAAGIEGDVVVEIVVNESGDVARARAVSGHPLLRDSSVRAARASKFKPTVRNGEPVKVSGTLTYYFRIGTSRRSEDPKKHRGSS